MEPVVPLQPRCHVWTTIRALWEAADWGECIRLVKAVVDADPYDVSQRYLLALLYLKVGNQRHALTQFERLLPLCVGRGDLYRALAMQMHVDELSPAAGQQEARYGAMQRWFRSLGINSQAVREGAVLQPLLFLSLAASGFARAAEACMIERHDPGVVERDGAPGTLWITLIGELRCAQAARDGSWEEERNLEEGHFVLVDPSDTRDSRFRLEILSPTELLRLPGEVTCALAAAFPLFAEALARLGPTIRGAQVPAWRPETQAIAGSPWSERDAAAESGASGAGESGAKTEPSASALRKTSPAPRPTLRIERRSTQRFTVSLAGSFALLLRPGAPTNTLEGTVRDLSHGGVSLSLAPGQDGSSIRPLINSLALIDVAGPDGQNPLRLSGWLRWCREHDGEWMIGVEFARLTVVESRALERLIKPALQNPRYRLGTGSTDDSTGLRKPA